MAHTAYTVRQGDSISSIAYEHGLFPDTVWNDAKNEELKQKRKDPDVLLPDDIVYLKEKELKEESCSTEKRHRFRRKGVPAKLQVQLMEEGKPRANLQYILEIDGSPIRDKTDGQGWIKHFIPPNAKKALLHIGNETITLEIGYLEPVAEISGVQERLANLGFNCGEPNGILDEKTGAAIRNFQAEYNLKVTGEPDQATRAKLEEVHGS